MAFTDVITIYAIDANSANNVISEILLREERREYLGIQKIVLTS